MSPHSPATIVIADDDHAIVDMYRLRFELEGWRVLVAHDGAEAVELSLAARPNLVLLDMQMPNVDGAEALRRLRADVRTQMTPVIVVSNTPATEKMLDVHGLGVLAWLVKSRTDPNQLTGIVRSYLSSSELHDSA